MSSSGTLVVNGTLVINGGTVIVNGGTLVVGGPVPPPKGMPPQGRPMARPMGNVAPPAFDARAIFNRLDTNKDGKLSFEEFSVGVQHLHRFLAARMGEIGMPFQRGMQFAREKMGQYRGQFAAHSGPQGPMGPMGQPVMGPMGPMGQPGMGPMGPMGHPGMGPAHDRKGPEGNKHEMKKPGVCKCGATKPEACKCGAKAPDGCKCGMKKPEAEKSAPHARHAEKATAGNRSIEARLTALETQQAEILTLLRSGVKPGHQTKEPARGGKHFHHDKDGPEHEDRD